MPDINMQVFEEAKRNQLVTEVDIQTQVALDDYQVQLSDIANPTQSQDNAVIDRFGEFLPHWNESLDFDTWVKMSMEVAGKRLLILHGNSNVSSVNSGDDTFIKFDDFEDNSFDTSKWSKAGDASSVTESTGNLKLARYADYNPIVYSDDVFGTDIIMEWTSKCSIGSYLMGFSDFITVGQNPLNNGDVLIIQPYTASNIQYTNAISGTRTNVEITPTVDTNYHDYKIVRNGSTNAKYYYDDAETIISGNLPTSNLRMYFTVSCAGITLEIEIVKIRKYTAIEPTIQISTQKNISIALKAFGRAG